MSHASKPTSFPVAEHPQRARVPARIILAHAVAVYLVFLAVLGYAAGFFAGLDVPKGIDQGPRAAAPVATAIDLLLLALFAVQHTEMARPWFKRLWTRIVPGPAERSTFVLATCLVLALLFWLWRPIGGTVWNLPGPGADALWAVYVAGWVLAIGSTFLISHFDCSGCIAFEEHDLVQSLGGTYAAYRARVPALIPRPWLGHPLLGAQRSEENDRKQAI